MKFKSNRHRRGAMRAIRLKYLKIPPFKSANVFPVQVSVLVPSTVYDKPISSSKFTKRVDSEKKWFDHNFGGDTAIKDVGSYLAQNGKLIKEKGFIVESSITSDKYNSMIKPFTEHIHKRIEQWRQQSVLVGIEGERYIIPYQRFTGVKKFDTEQKPYRKIIVT